MQRIPGYYEYDNDSLRPGVKAEGGLHQNLFDEGGHLRGSARFIPSDNLEEEFSGLPVENVYIPAQERLVSQDDAATDELIEALMLFGLLFVVEKGTPIAKRWWAESVRPRAVAAKESLGRRRPGRRSSAAAADPSVDAGDLESLVAKPAATMSRAEAEARYLAALAAKAYSDEQMRLVMHARIADLSGVEELEESVRTLPQEAVKSLISAMARDPRLLVRRV